MNNPIYQAMNRGGSPLAGMSDQINQLKKMYSDPQQAIQQMLNSGRVSQAQVNAAVQKAQQIARMMGGK